MKRRAERREAALSCFLNEVGDSAFMAGFNQVLVPDNIALMRALVNGASRGEIAEKFCMSSAGVTRLKRRMLNLRRMELRLVNGTSDVRLPAIWAPSFVLAAKFAAKHFCSSLDLPGWRIKGGDGSEVVLDDARRSFS